MSEDKLGLFNGEDMPTIESGWKMYQSGVEYNSRIKLNDTVKVNENFFIGKQWEGVEARGLPTPQFNFLKRVVGFVTSNITTDNISVHASMLSAAPRPEGQYIDEAKIINEEFAALTERNRIPSLLRTFARNAAVDGDGCIYTYWDDTAETGQTAKGDIKSEIVENTRVFFGNPEDRRVQAQPWIIISKRDMVRSAKIKAKNNGIGTWKNIKPDDENTSYIDSQKLTDDKVTVLLLLWKNEETGTVWAYEFTEKSPIKEAYDTGLRVYPVCWLNWDYVQDCYHGQAMLTGLIPNQMFVNKIWALSMLSLMKTAYPKYLYDKTRIKQWDNRVGAAIGINGGDINSVAKVIDPAAISPQVSQLITLAIDQSEQTLGATAVALGDTRPDNTSAIIALQRAAATPIEQTKQCLYECIEEMYRIYLEFMSEYYGNREVSVTSPEPIRQAEIFAGHEPSETTGGTFDFAELKNHPMTIKLDVGASSYYSEIASMQTLDHLLQQGHIGALQYLERIPDGYVPDRKGLILDLKAQQQAMSGQQMQPEAGGGGMPPGLAGGSAATGMEIPTGGGYSQMQRAINAGGEIPM